MAKDLKGLKWIEELLPTSFLRKHMFGGFAYYLNEKLIMTVFESPGDKGYKNLKFDFDVWNGVMFPIEKEFHNEMLKKFPFLINHPILPKWLYLPLETENFDSLIEEVLSDVKRVNSKWGVIPKPKNKKKLSSNKKTKAEKVEKIDTSKPRMFSHEEQIFDFASAKSISDLKNLGPASEKEFSKAGIKNAQQLIKLGWKKAYKKLVEANPRNRHSMFAYAIIGALTNKEWHRLDEDQKQEAREFTQSLKKAKK